MGSIRSLTGLRAVAAYSVLFAHAGDFHFGTNLTTHAAMTRLAYFGMSLFFVLSGFVIAYNYSGKLRTEGATGVYNFFVARFARLFPLYAAVLIFGYFFVLKHAGPLNILTHATLTQSWFNTEEAIYPPTWSISTEWAFYFVFAIGMLVLPKLKQPRLVLALVLITAPLLLLVLFVNRSAVLTLLSGPVFQHKHGSAELWYPWLTYYSPIVRIPEFIVGALAAKIYMSRGGNVAAPWAFLALAWCFGLLVFGGGLAGTPLDSLMPNFAYTPAIVVLILYLTQANAASSLFGCTVAIWLGEISYAVYLLQFKFFGDFGYFEVPLVQIAAEVIFITVLSGIVFVLYEAPMRRWVRSILARTSTSKIGFEWRSAKASLPTEP
jgi:peptidoglycan/LPS O-acetylase OafA/YrhL